MSESPYKDRIYGKSNKQALGSGQIKSRRGALQASASKVLEGRLEPDAAAFFGVTTQEEKKPRKYVVPAGKKILKDTTWNISQGYAQEHPQQSAPVLGVPAGKVIPRDPKWSPSDGYGPEATDDTAIPLDPQYALPDRKAIVTSIPAGKVIPKDAGWSLNQGYQSSAHHTSHNNLQGYIPAGVKVVKDPPWKPSDGLTREMFSRSQRDEHPIPSIPAGKVIPKDEPLRISSSHPESIESYRRNREYVAFTPEVQSYRQSDERKFRITAGKKIPRDPAFSLVYAAEKPVNASFSAAERAFFGISKGSGMRSETPQPY